MKPAPRYRPCTDGGLSISATAAIMIVRIICCLQTSVATRSARARQSIDAA
jgi:hypothetical protein